MNALVLCLALVQPDPELERRRAEQLKRAHELRAEVAALEARVELLRRMVPAEFEGPAVTFRIHELAVASAIDLPVVKRIDGTERVVLASGEATPYERVVLEVSGEADSSSLGLFLDRLSRLPLIVELHSLAIDPARLWSVRYTARLGVPIYKGWPGRAAGDELRQRWQTEVIALSEMRRDRAPMGFTAALARFETEVEGHSLVLTRARFGPAAVVEGVAVGALARAALRPTFEKAGFSVEKLEVAASGDCRVFSLTGRLAPAEEVELLDVPPIEVGPSRFDSRPAPSCTVAAAPSKGKVTAVGSAGQLTLRLRGVDLADVFRVLAQFSGENFVVDSDVEGRVDVDLMRATLDETLRAL